MGFEGVDVLLVTAVPPDELARQVGSVFGVPAERVSVISNIADYPDGRAADVVCVLRPVVGDLALHVSVDAHPLPVPFHDAQGFSVALASALAQPVVFPDPTPNPYAMRVARPDGTVSPATLNARALEREEYRVAELHRS